MAQNSDMVLGMLDKLKDKAKALGRSLNGALMHSDQGKLYKAGAYIKFMKRNGIERSMKVAD